MKPYEHHSSKAPINKRSSSSLYDDDGYRSLFTQHIDAVLSCDLQTKIIESNAAASMLFGYETKELSGMLFEDLLLSSELIDIKKLFKLVSGGTSRQIDVVLACKSGHTVDVNVTFLPKISNDEVVGVYVVAKDQSEQKRLENELMLTKEVYESFFLHSADSMVVLDLQGTVLQINSAFEKNYGWKQEEVVGVNFVMIQPEFQSEFVNLFQIVRYGGSVEGFETIRRHKSGKLFHISLTLSPVRNKYGNVTGIAGITRDITVKKQKEKEIKDREEHYRRLVELCPDGFVVYHDGEILFINTAGAEVLGIEKKENAIGESFISYIHPDSLDDMKKRMKLVEQGETLPFIEQKFISREGRSIYVEMTSVPIEYANMPAVQTVFRNITDRKLVEQALRESQEKYRIIAENTHDLIVILNPEGIVFYASPSHERVLKRQPRDYEGKSIFDFIHPEDREELRSAFDQKLRNGIELRKLHTDGEWVVFEAKGMSVTNEEGFLESYVVVFRDITERKQAEELLKKSDKLSVVGRLAAGVAHEIRNPLTALKGFTQLIASGNGKQQEYVDIMMSELERIEFIVSELLVLSKPQAISFQKKSVKNLLNDVVKLLEAEALLKNIQFVTNCEEDIPFIECEGNQLKQVLINLLNNGIESMEKGGTIVIEGKKQNNEQAVVRIIDQGCGIPEERLKQLGEPFYTTKEKGTGLGLMICYKIIENHKGKLHFYSKKGEGTTAEILLPFADSNR
ncbi:PAS domain S-box protein [Bacillus taeanensis]|uniref:histidine kinase n=1 Tax=Bacillus taeanensis TaxID=273032 RepID=A0A366XX37_9BACI|nr:PAS domain S-box protein [Bacillus taeanensis]RBW68703.1 hypothetical protein DS031_15220 [Bacillus taeanensis]